MAKKKKGSKKKSGKKSKDNPGIESAKEEIALDDAFGIDEPKEEKKEVAAPDEDAMNPIALYNKLSNVEDLLEKRDKEIAELKEALKEARAGGGGSGAAPRNDADGNGALSLVEDMGQEGLKDDFETLRSQVAELGKEIENDHKQIFELKDEIREKEKKIADLKAIVEEQKRHTQARAQELIKLNAVSGLLSRFLIQVLRKDEKLVIQITKEMGLKREDLKKIMMK